MGVSRRTTREREFAMQPGKVSTAELRDWITKYGVLARSNRNWLLHHHSTQEPIDFALMPIPWPRYLYRGQVRRYSPCLPSILRGVGKPARHLEELPREIALRITTNLLRSAWYCQLLDAHPVMSWADRRQLYFDRMALAQH